MGKTKTSKKHQRYLENLAKLDLDQVQGLEKADPLKELIDPHLVADAFFECLLNNDPEGFMEVVETYLEALNKANLRRQTAMHKSTMYSALKHRNPTIKTLAKMMYQSSHVPRGIRK